MLPTRTLGSQGLTVSALGLGIMSMSASYGAPEERDERESIATIHRAIELGCVFIDTAEAYGERKDKEEDLLGPATLAKMQSGELSFEDEAAAANAAGAVATDGAAPAEAGSAGKE